MTHQQTTKPLLFLLLTLLVVGCASTPEEDFTRNWSAAEFYNAAKESLKAGEFQQAIKHFETLEARFPFGRYAQQAQLEIIYAYYRYDEPDSAIAAADRFIKINPLHPYVDYAMYMKGLANFNRGVRFLDRWLEDSYYKRDQQAARDAYRDFEALIDKFPDSRYASDARKRLVYLLNTLAAHEVHVAQYYFERNAYVAAANRARHVIENYQQTPAVAEALVLMIRAYTALELHNLADDARRVLARNFPDRLNEVDAINKTTGNTN